MRTALRVFFAALLAMVTCSACLAAKGSSLPDAAQHPREIYQALNALRVDSARIYAVTEIRLRRDAVSSSSRMEYWVCCKPMTAV
jgi:hypothetical protein